MIKQSDPTESSTATAVPTQDDDKIIAERRERLVEVRRQDIVFPSNFRPTHHAGDLRVKYRELEQTVLEAEPAQVAIAGCMTLKYVMGETSSAIVQDSADHTQFYISRDAVDEGVYASLKKQNLGGVVAARGTLMKTKTGGLSVAVTELRLLPKGLRPLPGDYYGLVDQEQKYRQCYVDLIVSKKTHDTFRVRTKAMAPLRNLITGNGFIKVEAPMLYPIPGGTAIKPFIMYHNALNIQMFLRIASELYLKRLIIDGFERMYEINYNFCNEDVSPRHNPEFTIMEFYAAYTSYRWLMDFTEQLIRQAAIDASGTTTLTYQGRELDLAKPSHRLTICRAIQKCIPQYMDVQLADVDFLHAEPKKFEIDTNAPQFLNAGVSTLQLVLFEEAVESQLWEPTFIVDYPVEVSLLTRGSDTLPGITECFELSTVGRKIASGFSGLNDPEDQVEHFRKQVEQEDAGDEEVMLYGINYIRALEYGMPLTGGCSIGIDHLVILLTDSPNIRSVILPLHLRHED